MMDQPNKKINFKGMQLFNKGQYAGEVVKTFAELDIMATMTTYWPDNFNRDQHGHRLAHFGFTLEGACIEKREKKYTISPGEITYYDAEEPHQAVRILQPLRRVNIELSPPFFENYDVSGQALRHAVTTNPDAKFLMVEILKEFREPNGFSNTAVVMSLLKMIGRSEKLQPGNTAPQWVRAVQTLLRDRWDEQVSLQELSVEAGVHPVTISKYFPVYFSCTLGEYLRKLKAEKALGLIKCPPVSLAAVGYACGFADQSHFARIFKKQTGVLPGAYQKL